MTSFLTTGFDAAPAPQPDDLIKDTDTQNFMPDVLEASKQTPVIVDFWAPWCGPCKQLTPVLEKAVKSANGAVKMVKINVDENQEIAAQLRVQSIPAVFAFKDGRPVDAFMGAMGESQVKTFIEKLMGSAIEDPAAELVEAGHEAMAAGDLAQAGQMFAQAIQHNRENTGAIAGLAKCQIEAKDFDGAAATLALTPPDKDNDPEITSARTALELAQNPVDENDIERLEQSIEERVDDHQSRLDLAVALNASGRQDEALDHLLWIIEADRNWNDEAARKQLLKFFEAWGSTNELTIAGRRRLSSLLFS